ncbi:flagellar hook-length control protein FliK [Halomonas sabkhae]|uniref:flagellar hook-length control protein FliK n=1 Tax=Halomonas sabkhae TaxID=626223 RepID=UPI0025B30F58|nr:flagellar hook-length control protein FliK [Halomonas sabkhae]MDN3524862.1 flagellar hook-length control protein FliK [Halomonas sabkhae]
MSGITPLLDTLLHQVLGKRADVPPPRDLNQPVKPVAPGDAPRALHSDSRLDARAPPERAAPSTPEAPRTSGPITGPDAATSASTHTHFSATARAIADLLLRFPAPTSVVTPAAPLMSADQSISPSQLAQRLEGSVRDSGLFYESHLARWFAGGLSRQQLEREPQMWRTLTFTPGQVSPSQAGAGPMAGAAAISGEAGSSATEVTRSSAVNAMAGREPVHEHLQGLVRHQLEMLASPTLRWEGDVWSGLFMALAVHLPPEGREHRREGGESASSDHDDEEGSFRSELTLKIEGLGDMRVALRMGATTLGVTLQVRDATILSNLGTELETLRQRLEHHGFEHVQLRLENWGEEEE